MSRMMTYAWQDLDFTNVETKFGDHFVEGDVTLDEATEHTTRYIRQYQFPRQSKHFDSDRVQHIVWDVSEAAMEHNKFYGASKMDDIIRPSIAGLPGGRGKEFHAVPIEDVIIDVNKWINKSKQPRPCVTLSTAQYDVAVDVLNAMSNGKRTILAELCARFGKTLWSGAIAKESQRDVIIIASYVLTSFSSFVTDLTSFEQFRDFVHIDTKEPDYQEQINNAITKGTPVVVYLSLHESESKARQKRIDYLYSLDNERLTVIDEADYGAHTANQALPLINAVSDNDVVILMTGTDSDRAATEWKPDHFVSVTYPELLMNKAAANAA